MFLNDSKSDTGPDIVNLFADHFGSVYDKNNEVLLNDYFDDCIDKLVNINSLSIGVGQVFKHINELKNSLSVGPDGIPSFLLKQCVYALSVPLQKIFSLSLSSGSFPQQWKYSYVCPIHKSGNKSDITNYRPISIISHIPKIFESIITNMISTLFKYVISENQHGFFAARSACTNLLCYQNKILNAFDKGHQIDSVYTDFSKAFDKVNHQVLLMKLSNNGLSGPLLSWFKTYLSERFQIIRYKNYYSRPIHVTSGVPQGAHLAPLLFSLFINDIKDVILFSDILLFADDIKIYRPITSLDDCYKLQMDLNSLNLWCSKNKMSLNVNKCKSMSFYKIRSPIIFQYHIDNCDLDRVAAVVDLGVLFTHDLNFKAHINNICNRALRSLGFVTRNTGDFSDAGTIRAIYFSIVRSLLEYCTPIWTPYQTTLTNKIEKINQKFLRLLKFKNYLSHVDSYLSLLEIFNTQTLASRRFYHDMMLLYKIINGLIDCSYLLQNLYLNIPSMNTRNPLTFSIKSQRTNYLKFGPINRIVTTANTFADIEFFGINEAKFKKSIDCEVRKRDIHYYRNEHKGLFVG